jgi:hypothetical protein
MLQRLNSVEITCFQHQELQHVYKENQAGSDLGLCSKANEIHTQSYCLQKYKIIWHGIELFTFSIEIQTVELQK